MKIWRFIGLQLVGFYFLTVGFAQEPTRHWETINHSYQGETCHCAGYAVLHALQYRNWKLRRIQPVVDLQRDLAIRSALSGFVPERDQNGRELTSECAVRPIRYEDKTKKARI